MRSRVTELSCKEVINVCTGVRYGYVNDIEVDCTCGKIVSIIVHGKGVCGSLFSRNNDIVIPWENIKRIGEDIILVDFDMDFCDLNRKKGIFSK